MIHKSMIALAAVLLAGTISAAAANDQEAYPGGARIGPLGQVFGPARGSRLGFAQMRRSHERADQSFAYVPGYRHIWRHEY